MSIAMYIEKDGALDRRFQKVLVEPLSPEETVQILINIKSKYEDFHGVTYTDDAIRRLREIKRPLHDRQVFAR
jgi:ATP-dependent Clp protease ATP-binding subunit ClpA